MNPNVQHYLLARFVPGPFAPSFRSSRAKLAHTQVTNIDVWDGQILVVTPGGRERLVRLRITWKDCGLVVRSQLEGMSGRVLLQTVAPLQIVKGTIPLFTTESMDFFGEGVGARIEIEESVGT